MPCLLVGKISIVGSNIICTNYIAYKTGYSSSDLTKEECRNYCVGIPYSGSFYHGDGSS